MSSGRRRPIGESPGDEVHAIGPELPASAHPVVAGRGRAGAGAARREAGRLVEAALEEGGEPHPLRRIAEIRLVGVDIDRQPPFALEVVPGFS